MDWLNSSSIVILDKSMDALWQRERVIADNIANATTPGYKRKVLSFEEELAQKLDSVRFKKNKREVRDAIASTEFIIAKDDKTTMNVDGNNVELDEEYLLLMETAKQYEYAERLLTDKFNRLRYAIKGGQ